MIGSKYYGHEKSLGFVYTISYKEANEAEHLLLCWDPGNSISAELVKEKTAGTDSTFRTDLKKHYSQNSRDVEELLNELSACNIYIFKTIKKGDYRFEDPIGRHCELGSLIGALFYDKKLGDIYHSIRGDSKLKRFINVFYKPTTTKK